jgi:hypothetical protein
VRHGCQHQSWWTRGSIVSINLLTAPSERGSADAPCLATGGRVATIGAGWTYGYVGERWEAVDAAMLHLEARVLANREDVDTVARRAYVAMTGDDDLNAWIDRKLDSEEKKAGSS